MPPLFRDGIALAAFSDLGFSLLLALPAVLPGLGARPDPPGVSMHIAQTIPTVCPKMLA